MPCPFIHLPIPHHVSHLILLANSRRGSLGRNLGKPRHAGKANSGPRTPRTEFANSIHICPLCNENETPDGHNTICDPCYDNAGTYLERNIKLIKAIPYLMDACNPALTEIDQWKAVMGGDDPRTDVAITALEEAIAMTA